MPTLKRLLLFSGLYFWQLDANAANLLEVYQQALCSDPIFKQAIAQSWITRDNVPISMSYILPNISLFTNPAITRYNFSGTKYKTGSIGNLEFIYPRNFTQRANTLELTLQQPIFNFGLYANILVQLENAKSACATLNAALQNLMVRVSSAYFAVLKDKEEIIYTIASKRYYLFQLNQVNDQYQAGYKTLTDVYTARAAYETAASALIVANKTLANDLENLRAITNVYYPHLSYLKNDLPLITPKPKDSDQWVKIAIQQNWSIKAAQYSLEASKHRIKQQFAGHLPIISLQGSFTRNYVFNINRYTSFTDNYGAGSASAKAIGINVDFPLFEGGRVISKTNQALHFYEKNQEILEENVRNTVNKTRQSFVNIIAEISQIKADQHVISASTRSLQGTIDRYNAGIQTLLDVLNREELLYAAQITYASDRYEYVNNILMLKEAAGTLSFEDLRTINSWLIDDNNKQIQPFQDKLLHQAQLTIDKNRSKKKINNNVKNKINDSKNNTAQKQINIDRTDLIAQIREVYKKMEDQNLQSNSELTKLKTALSELKQELQIKSKQLQFALKKVEKLEKKRIGVKSRQ